MVLSVVMVFIFAYQLIMLVIDPDGKGKGAMSQVVKDTLISLEKSYCSLLESTLVVTNAQY